MTLHASRFTIHEDIRIRFAPSPTGFLHVGGARTALFNWLFARHHKGKFILRIEDTDLVRSTKDYLNSILDDLKWLGLDYDEGPELGGQFGPYFQTQRVSLYREYTRTLIDKKSAYYCYCTPEELALQREELKKQGKPPGYTGQCRSLSKSDQQKLIQQGKKPAIRFKASKSVIKFNDLIRGSVEFDANLIDDFVIVKSDGIPVYNFAVVVDDYLMKISHIIRGEEHLSNTPRQIMLIEALGFSQPFWAHLPIILNIDRSKLSKRQGGLNIADFRNRGFLSQTLINFLVLLGWSPGGDRELLDLNTIIKEFDLSRVPKHPAVFDEKKLEWMNSQYIKKISIDELVSKSQFYLQEEFPNHHLLEQKVWLKRLLALFKDRLKTLNQLPNQTAYFFKDVLEYDPKGIKKYFSSKNAESVKGYLIALKEELKKLDLFNETTIEDVLRGLAERLNIRPSDLIHPVRLVLTGRTVSPGLFEVMALLGKEQVLKRLDKVIEDYDNIVTSDR